MPKSVKQTEQKQDMQRNGQSYSIKHLVSTAFFDCVKLIAAPRFVIIVPASAVSSLPKGGKPRLSKVQLLVSVI